MKTITKTYQVYDFDELSEKAKEKALNDWQTDNENPWNDENWKTIRLIEEAFGIGFKDYGYYNTDIDLRLNEYPYDWENNGVLELKGVRAYSFLEKMISEICYGGYSIYTKEGKKEYWEHKYYKGKFRRSKLDYEQNDYPLNGYCYACNVPEAWKDWKETLRKNKNLSVEDYFDILADRLSKEFNHDNKWYLSEEGLKDYALGNDWGFLENGKKFSLN